MRKILLILLCAIMCLTLFACGRKAAENTPEEAPAYEKQDEPAAKTENEAAPEGKTEPEEILIVSSEGDNETAFDTETEGDTSPLADESEASRSTGQERREETAPAPAKDNPGPAKEPPAPAETDNGQGQQEEESEWSPMV